MWGFFLFFFEEPGDKSFYLFGSSEEALLDFFFFCLLVGWRYPLCGLYPIQAQRVQPSVSNSAWPLISNSPWIMTFCLGCAGIINTAIIGGRGQPVSHISQAWKDACLLLQTVAMVIMNDTWQRWVEIDFLPVNSKSYSEMGKHTCYVCKWRLAPGERNEHKSRLKHYTRHRYTHVHAQQAAEDEPRDNNVQLLREGNDIRAQTQEQ